jgi:DNA-binding MarR family transcriptional regulator
MTVTGPQTPVKQPRVGPPQELLSSASFLLKRLAWALKDRTLAAFEPTGLSPYHYAVLALLEEEPRETQVTIADALGYDRSQLVGWLDELEERGLIERRRDANDRRRHLVSMTPEGKRALRRLRAIVQAVDDEFFAPLAAEQRAALQALLLPLALYHDPRCAAASLSLS